MGKVKKLNKDKIKNKLKVMDIMNKSDIIHNLTQKLTRDVNKIVQRKIQRRNLVRRAVENFNQGKFLKAAELYEDAIHLGKPSTGLVLQCAHMFKEAREFSQADRYYRRALQMAPEDSEIQIQLGHFYKTIGRYIDAEHHYRQAVRINPHWREAQRELDGITYSEEINLERKRISGEDRPELSYNPENCKEISNVSSIIDESLFPVPDDELHSAYEEGFVFSRNGQDQTTKWGSGLTLRGIDALRGHIISRVPYLYIEIFVDGESVYKENLIPYKIPGKNNEGLSKYIYNAWIDFSKFSFGWHELVFRAVNVHGKVEEGKDWRRERVIIAPRVPVGAFEECDNIAAPLDSSSSLSIVEQINNRPSVIHAASTKSLPLKDVKTIAVLRPDQLGDMVITVPALLQLREIFPHAKIVGLLSFANEGLAKTLNVFDEIILLNFPDDPVQRKRVMDRKTQEALICQLAPYKFDLAINFPVSGNSHKLLPLTGAPVTAGFGGDGNKTLSISVSTHDPVAGCDVMRHSARTKIMSQTFALWLDSTAKVIKREDLSRDILVPLGINQDEKFAVLHGGSRIKFTQWPYYAELSELIANEIGIKVVFIADNEDQISKIPSEMIDSKKIIVIRDKLDFDQFDALLSFCSAFVGNDSGPKHLASLRGAQVVSIHSARIGWSEWGQELSGVVISRQVPCGSCSLHHHPEECGQGVACITKIKIEEVYEEVKRILS